MKTAAFLHHHSAVLLEYLHTLYQQSRWCDIVIHANDGTIFNTHRVVVAASSTYLHNIFLANQSSTSIFLDIPSAVLQSLFQFCYTGQLEMSEQILLEVKQAAVFLQMDRVVAHLNSRHAKVTKDTTSSMTLVAMETDGETVTSNRKLDGSASWEEENVDDIIERKSVLVIKSKTVSKMIPISKKASKKPLHNSKCCENKQKLASNTETQPILPIRVSARKKKPKITEDYITFTSQRVKQSKEPKLTVIKPRKYDKQTGTKKTNTKKNIQQKVISSNKADQKKSSQKKKCKEKTHNSVNKQSSLKIKSSGIFKKIYKPKMNRSQCDICNVTFSAFYKLRRHYLKQHSENYIRLLWGKCILKKSLTVMYKLHGKQKCSSNHIYNMTSTSIKRKTQHGRKYTLPRSPLKSPLQFVASKLKHYRLIGNVTKSEHLDQSIQKSDLSSGLLASKPKGTDIKNDNMMFECPLCKRKLKAQYSVFKHLQLVHQLPDEEAKTVQFVLPSALTCEAGGACLYSTTNLQEMRRHMKTHHPSIKYSCTQCQSSFPLSLLLDRHMVTSHLSRKSCAIQCQDCKKTFPRRQGLKRHQFFKHGIQLPGVKVYECVHPGCAFKTLSAYSLKTHKGKHNDEKPFTCEHCGMKLKTEKSHRKHVEKMHLDIRPYLCQICGMRFGEEHELKSHCLCRHSTEKCYQCEYCPYATSNKVTFYTHLYNVHKVQSTEDKREIFQCPQCPYTCILKYRYKIHLNSHQGKRDFLCKFCDQTFVSSAARLSHTQWKHSAKVFTCSQCNYQTKTSQKLNEHIRVQHQLKGIFPYKCPYCSFKCGTGGNARKHVKQVHKNKEVTYIRDDDLLAAARVARASGNYTELTNLAVPADSVATEASKTDANTETVTDNQMLEIIC